MRVGELEQGDEGGGGDTVLTKEVPHQPNSVSL